MNNEQIFIHDPQDFQKMRKAGLLAATILDDLQDIIEPGISTEQSKHTFIKILFQLAQKLF